MIEEERYLYEIQKGQAIREVLALNIGDNFCLHEMGGADLERSQLWQEAAKKCPQFSRQILAIRKAMLEGGNIPIGRYPQVDEALERAGFSDISSGGITIFLRHIYYSGIADGRGGIYSTMNLAAEADLMRTELLGKETGRLTGLQLKDAIRAALSGNLKLTRQT